MLKLNKNIEYALLAIKYIEDNRESGPHTAREISDNANIPYDILSKILQRLKKESLLDSVQGTKGGYSLSKDLSALSLGDLVKYMGHDLKIVDCMVDNPTPGNCARVNECCIRPPLLKLQNKLESFFEQTTLAELLSS